MRNDVFFNVAQATRKKKIRVLPTAVEPMTCDLLVTSPDASGRS